MIAKKNIQFDFDIKGSVLFKRHFGDVSFDAITEAWDWAFENKIVPEGTNRYLLDYRDALILDIAKSSELIVGYYRLHIDRFKGSKVAIVSTNPKNVALSMLMCRVDDGYTVKPFSTIEMALEWLSE